ncbi:MAG: restriction endonuclease subunit S, partial [Methylococcales bacterium]
KELEANLLKGKYELKKFVSLIIYISSGATPLKANAEQFYSDDPINGIPLLRVQNITSEGLKLDDVIFINRDTHENDLKRSQVFSGDLLITITGRIASSAVAPQAFEGNINQHSVIVRTNKSSVINEYLAIYFNSFLGQKFALQKTTGGTRPALDYLALKSLKIPLPPLEEQSNIVEQVNAIRAQAKALQLQAQAELDQAKQHVERMILGETP